LTTIRRCVFSVLIRELVVFLNGFRMSGEESSLASTEKSFLPLMDDANRFALLRDDSLISLSCVAIIEKFGSSPWCGSFERIMSASLTFAFSLRSFA
jgi:hypothetical protein